MFGCESQIQLLDAVLETDMRVTFASPPVLERLSTFERASTSFAEMVLKSDTSAVTTEQFLTALFSIRHSLQDASRFATELLDRFASLLGIVQAPWEKVSSVSGIAHETWLNLQVAIRLSTVALREPLVEPLILNSYGRLYDYLTLVMGHDTAESARILYLGTANNLIKDEIHCLGTINHVMIYPREIVSRACELRAMSVIIAHNHPSGDPTPSDADISMTQSISRILKSIGIELHDHVIVGKSRHYSLKKSGYI